MSALAITPGIHHVPLRPAPRTALRTALDLGHAGGLRAAFGLIGGTTGRLMHELGDSPIRNVQVTHENSALQMARVFAEVTGTPALVHLTAAAGLFNGMLGLAALKAARVPGLIWVGDVARNADRRGTLQNLGRRGFQFDAWAGQVAKSVMRVECDAALPEALLEALDRCQRGVPGPVCLIVPADLGGGMYDPASTPGLPRIASPELRADCNARCEAGIREVVRARTPMILAGRGAASKRCRSLLRALADKAGIPVVTSPRAKSVFPGEHPLSLGTVGHGGHEMMARYIDSGVDLVLVLGCGLNETSTNNWTIPLNQVACRVQVDIDEHSMSVEYPPTHRVCMSAESFLERLLAHLPARPTPTGLPPWTEYGSTTSHAGHNHVAWIRALHAIAPANTIHVVDVGEHLLCATHHLRLREDEEFVVENGIGGLGSGISGAAGAALAAPDRPVMCHGGDYGWRMVGMELETSVREGLGIVFVIYDDARMAMVERGQFVRGLESFGLRNGELDFVAFARSLGVSAMRVESPDELAKLRPDLFTRGRPSVLVLAVDPESEFAGPSRGAQIEAALVDVVEVVA